jgi:hypothetical protein
MRLIVFCLMFLFSCFISILGQNKYLGLGIKENYPLNPFSYDLSQIGFLPPILNIEFGSSKITEKLSLDFDIFYSESNKKYINDSKFYSSLGIKKYFNTELKGFSLGAKIGYFNLNYEDKNCVHEYDLAIVNSDTLFYKNLNNKLLYLIPNVGYKLIWKRFIMAAQVDYNIVMKQDYNVYKSKKKNSPILIDNIKLFKKNFFNISLMLGIKI